jgi:hypothetical protein
VCNDTISNFGNVEVNVPEGACLQTSVKSTGTALLLIAKKCDTEQGSISTGAIIGITVAVVVIALVAAIGVSVFAHYQVN